MRISSSAWLNLSAISIMWCNGDGFTKLFEYVDGRRQMPQTTNERTIALFLLSQIYRVVAHKFRNEMTGSSKNMPLPSPPPHFTSTHTCYFPTSFISCAIGEDVVLLCLLPTGTCERRAHNEHRTEQIETSFLVIIRLYRKSFPFIFYLNGVRTPLRSHPIRQSSSWSFAQFLE